MANQKHFETMQNLERGVSFNLFTQKDHAIVRRALAELNELERSLIVLRFWEKNTLFEMGEILDLSFEEVEQKLSIALEKLKPICLNQKGFSRANNKTLPESESKVSVRDQPTQQGAWFDEVS